MIRHPTFARLRRFARLQPSRHDPRVAAHVLACTNCRLTVESIGSVIAAAEAMPADATPRTAFDIVAQRVRAGDRVLLPVDAPARVSRRGSVLRRGAVAAALIAGAILVLTGTPEIGAMRSELIIEPAQPREGETLSLRYRATSLLSDEPRLVVRARVRTPQDGREGRMVTLGTLLPGEDRVYEGTLALPDSVVLAVLAVESEDGSKLDVNGERWEVLVHGDDGRPLVAALLQRRMDASRRDTRIDGEVAAQLVALYPERPESWDAAWIAEAMTLGNDAVDSLNAYHREHHLPRLEVALAANPAPDARALGAMMFYTGRIEDEAAMARWKDMLYERHPDHGFALMWRTNDLDEEHRGDTDGRMRAYEQMWTEVGPTASQLTLNALSLAVRLGDPELVRTWGERMERTDSTFNRLVTMRMAQFSELRPAAIRRMERELERTLDLSSSGRPLRYTPAEFRELREREAGGLHFTLGTMLVAQGDTTAALAAFRRAAAAGWDAARFRSLGEVYLALGDTAAATHALARAAVDPITARAFSDSAVATLRSLETGAWAAALADAREAMLQATWRESIRRTPQRSQLRLLDGDGSRVDVDLQGAITVVAFWSRYCPASIDQLSALDRVAAALEGDGVRVLIITDEEDPAAAAAYLRGKGVAFATLLDTGRDAHNAFDNRGAPVYFVLDRRGAVRFSGHSPGAVPRQVEAVRQSRSAGT